eukprot:3834055-Rhodomonas_salina.1
MVVLPGEIGTVWPEVVAPRIVLHSRYAVCGTGIGYAATGLVGRARDVEVKVALGSYAYLPTAMLGDVRG